MQQVALALLRNCFATFPAVTSFPSVALVQLPKLDFRLTPFPLMLQHFQNSTPNTGNNWFRYDYSLVTHMAY